MKSGNRVRHWPLLLILLVSCAGGAARDNVTLPAIRFAWHSIRVEADRVATADASADGKAAIAAADAALADGSVAKVVAVDWPTIRDLAATDIVRRSVAAEIGPSYAASLNEELRLFFEESIPVYTRSKP